MFRIILVIAVFFIFVVGVKAQTTEFTFQGSLKDGAVAANGNYDFEFALFDALAAGGQIGATIPRNNVTVASGIFSVKLNFGPVFPGDERFLEIRVRMPQKSGGASWKESDSHAGAILSANICIGVTCAGFSM